MPTIAGDPHRPGITGHAPAPETPATDRVRRAYARIEETDRPEAWIALRPQAEVLAEAERVDARVAAGEDLQLAGTVIAVKDNIDVAGLPTTAGCPAYSYRPTATAPAVDRLCRAGAIVLGKTNMDQFATGLVGTRSPYGPVRCVHDPARVAGGSSSGSAVVVALGIADLALGTDTAGSGRVPAAFQGIVGVKPTLGLIPNTGTVPAARSFDCVTVFARTVTEAQDAVHLMSGPDGTDPRTRVWPADAPPAAAPVPRVAVPTGSLPGLSAQWAAAFAATVDRLAAAGIETVPVNVQPFLDAATLLYGGAFAAERYAAVGEFIDAHPGDVDPSVRTIIGAAREVRAYALVNDIEKLDRLRAQAAAELAGTDALLLPTAPEHPTIAEVAADPIGVNSRLGVFTNFVNLLDLCAVAVPADVDRSNGRHPGNAPFGVTVIGRAFADHVVADIARRLIGETETATVAGGPRGGGARTVPLVVIGAHLSGGPLNGELTAGGARLAGPVRTAPCYRMHALPTRPPKPGLVRTPDGDGCSIEGELWLLSPAALGVFLSRLPAPMALGTLLLDDGSTATGFLCEPYAVAAQEGATDISHYGGWRAYLADQPRRS